MINTENPVIEITAGSVGEPEANEIYRNLQILYGTHTGEQALDRDFGIDVSCTDYPIQSAQSMLVAEYVRKTRKYEPRARVAQVDWLPGEAKDGAVIPKVVIEIVKH